MVNFTEPLRNEFSVHFTRIENASVVQVKNTLIPHKALYKRKGYLICMALKF